MVLTSPSSKTVQRSRSFADAETLIHGSTGTDEGAQSKDADVNVMEDDVLEQVRSGLNTARFTSMKGTAATVISPQLLEPSIRLRFMKAANFEMEPAKRLLAEYAVGYAPRALLSWSHLRSFAQRTLPVSLLL
jgi:hypothetical protein